MIVSPRLADLVRERAGVQLPPQRMLDLTRSVEKMMKRGGFDTEPTYLSALEDGRASLDDLVEDMSIGETYFFREPAQWAYLRTHVIPALRELGRPVRAWSAGCASGEEAYSLAITFEEQEIEGSILATDISRELLAEAREGRFGKWSLRGPEAARAKSWMNGELLDERIRRRVVFQQLNLATDPVLGRDFDLIFCRNVLIYFEHDVIARVAKKLHDALSFGGWMFTASSDPPLAVGDLHRVPEDVIAYRRMEIVRTKTPLPRERTPRPRLRRPPPSSRRAKTPLPIPHDDLPSVPAADSQYEEAVHLIDERRDDDALAMLRRAIYLDQNFVVAHLALGLLLARKGDRRGAKRELGIVKKLCAAAPPEAVIPHSGGTCAAQLAGIAASEEARLGHG